MEHENEGRFRHKDHSQRTISPHIHIWSGQLPFDAAKFDWLDPSQPNSLLHTSSFSEIYFSWVLWKVKWVFLNIFLTCDSKFESISLAQMTNIRENEWILIHVNNIRGQKSKFYAIKTHRTPLIMKQKSQAERKRIHLNLTLYSLHNVCRWTRYSYLERNCNGEFYYLLN